MPVWRRIKSKTLLGVGLALMVAVLSSLYAQYFFDMQSDEQFALQSRQLAQNISNGHDELLVLGALLALGKTNQAIFDVATGSAPLGMRANNALTDVVQQFSLEEIMVLNKSGIVTAFVPRPDAPPHAIPGVGRDLSFRPYFTAAMAGMPTLYAAVGTRSGERGFYIAAPILDRRQALPSGVLVAKIGFREVDAALSRQSNPFAIVSPEGVIFASNLPDWRYRILPLAGPIANPAGIRRSAAAFKNSRPKVLPVDRLGRVEGDGWQGRLVVFPVDWMDPQGSWHLVGVNLAGRSARACMALGVGLFAFVLVQLVFSWVAAHRALRLNAKALEISNRELAILNKTDALTGVGNRRRFDEILAQEWLRHLRSGKPLSLILIDVDWFKKYNDRYGHFFGDECLRTVANALADTVRRAPDCVCRFGGEEFAVLLPISDADAAFEVGERLRVAVEALAIRHEDSPFGQVTISIGLATTDAEIGTAEQLYGSADKALYQAKASGRNQTRTAAFSDFLD
ncbi:GGDEF domain-containing protein [Paludibacterium purpuratum]|uniref:diguanylate cyclase n=1 Tax=Paludibacterium purpuratum TaxID=1144873 RepID=A0A4R7B2U6_9NEIS|nr:sensor domain-containing diguanylate cyclase [Paludibacterium purpuratum]TDR76484.1 diguanylate cyclase (GGDEF)-like protein [Paludibacterium purpuratum]